MPILLENEVPRSNSFLKMLMDDAYGLRSSTKKLCQGMVSTFAI